MRVLNLSENDYGQYAHQFSNALRSVGVDSVDLVQSLHPFKYASQGQRATVWQMTNAMTNADVVVIHHSHPVLFELAKNNCKGKVIVTHTGTRYREQHESLDVLFGDTLAFSDQSEFFVINPKLKYIVSPVEFELAPTIKDKPIKFAHYPSNTDVKGTVKIMEMMEQFSSQCDFKVGSNLVDHYFQLERIAKCDVYIELFKPELNGRPYGCFGVTGLEAASMGKVVLTNNLYPKVYTDAYGVCPMTTLNTESNFMSYVRQFLKLDVEFIRQIQVQNYELMKENHSYIATGNRIIKAIYE